MGPCWKVQSCEVPKVVLGKTQPRRPHGIYEHDRLAMPGTPPGTGYKREAGVSGNGKDGK